MAAGKPRPAMRAIGSVELGRAVFTPGYGLPARFVVHTATPAWGSTGRELEVLAQCYESALSLADQDRVISLVKQAGFLGGLTSIFMMSAISFIVSRQVLRPVRAARLIAAGRAVAVGREAEGQSLFLAAAGSAATRTSWWTWAVAL